MLTTSTTLVTLTLYLIYGIIASIAVRRGYQSPLFGASGILLFVVLQMAFPVMSKEASFEEYLEKYLDGREFKDTSFCILFLDSAIVSVASISGLVLLLPRKNPRAEAKKSKMPYAVMGHVCAILSAVFFLPSAALGFVEGLPFVPLFMLSLNAMFACYRLAQQQARPSVAEMLQRDRRAPVLFLRSFRSDAIRTRHPFLMRCILPGINVPGESFDEFLAPALNILGPFVGLGNPEDYLPTLGASKVYVHDHLWEQTVKDFLLRAKLVILLEGDTPGLRWELTQIRQQCSPRSVFLVTPTEKFQRAGWQKFAELLLQAGFVPPDTDVGQGTVIGFNKQHQPVVLCRNSTTANEYVKVILDWHESTEDDLHLAAAGSLEPTNLAQTAKNQKGSARALVPANTPITAGVGEGHLVRKVDFFPHAFACECGRPVLVQWDERGRVISCLVCEREYGPFDLRTPGQETLTSSHH
jgi:hypothetical protein